MIGTHGSARLCREHRPGHVTDDHDRRGPLGPGPRQRVISNQRGEALPRTVLTPRLTRSLR